MPDLFWVGGTSTWNSTDGLKWALVSGGAGGQPKPTATDNVFFDAASGASVVTIGASAASLNIDFTGFTGSIIGTGNIAISGNLVLGASMGWTNTGNLNFISTGAQTITTNGLAITSPVIFNGVGGSWTLQDALVSNAPITLTRGSFITNGFNVTVDGLDTNNGNVRTLDITNSTISLTGIGGTYTSTIWNASNVTNLTFNAAGSTIKVLRTSGNTTGLSFGVSSLTYNNIWFTGSLSGTTDISGLPVFNDFKDDIPLAHGYRFSSTAIITVTTWDMSGTIGNVINLISATPGSSWGLVATSGTIASDYVSLTDSAASGGAIFIATNSADNDGNTGWIFSSNTPTSGATAMQQRFWINIRT